MIWLTDDLYSEGDTIPTAEGLLDEIESIRLVRQERFNTAAHNAEGQS